VKLNLESTSESVKPLPIIAGGTVYRRTIKEGKTTVAGKQYSMMRETRNNKRRKFEFST
jgi:hypothetical protein